MSDPVAAFYSGLRGSRVFVYGLSAFIAIWVGLNYATGFDAGWGGLNLLLSIEASIGMSLFMTVAAQQDAKLEEILAGIRGLLEEVREQNRALLHLDKAQLVLMEAALGQIRQIPAPDKFGGGAPGV